MFLKVCQFCFTRSYIPDSKLETLYNGLPKNHQKQPDITSGSLVIDIMSANGDQDPPVLQRVFWALIEGGTATALLVAGGSDSLKALQVRYRALEIGTAYFGS